MVEARNKGLLTMADGRSSANAFMMLRGKPVAIK